MRTVNIDHQSETRAHLTVSDIGYVLVLKFEHDFPPGHPWHLVGFGMFFESLDAGIAYLKSPSKSVPLQMSECEVAYSGSCCNGSVYSN